ncbi:MAG: DoxX family membrane protein [Chloroflexi bacterium]|nr:DoxX family membrane protein [Chloroflexota bacterium]
MSEVLGALDQHHVQLLLRLTLGGLLVLAAITKLTDRAAFQAAVAEYQLLPHALERPFAAALPIVELTLGALLLAGLGTAIAAWVAVPVFLSFSIAIGVNMARGRELDCHCFGSVQSEPIGWPSLIRSSALIIAALIVASGASAFGGVDALLLDPDGLPPASEIVPVVLLAFVIFDVIILLPEAIATQLSFDASYGSAGNHHVHHGDSA